MKDFGRWFEETAEYLKAEEPPQACDTCDGEGTIDERLGGEFFSDPEAECPNCGGKGYFKCQVYNGLGVKSNTKIPCHKCRPGMDIYQNQHPITIRKVKPNFSSGEAQSLTATEISERTREAEARPGYVPSIPLEDIRKLADHIRVYERLEDFHVITNSEEFRRQFDQVFGPEDNKNGET